MCEESVLIIFVNLGCRWMLSTRLSSSHSKSSEIYLVAFSGLKVDLEFASFWGSSTKSFMYIFDLISVIAEYK